MKYNKKRIIIVALIIILLVGGVVLSIFFKNKFKEGKISDTMGTDITGNEGDNSKNEAGNDSMAEDESQDMMQDEQKEELEEEIPQDTQQKEESTDIPNKQPDDSHNNKPEDDGNRGDETNSNNPSKDVPPVNKTEENNNNYDFSNSVPKSQNVGLDYFKDAVFIGDSRTEGFMINNGLSSKTTAYTSKGLQVNTIFTDKVINMNGQKVTIIEALRNTSFSKAYIMLGINETGWVNSNLFIKKYGEIIDEIKRINPNCKIYVQSILPVSQKVSNEHAYIKNARINEYNSLIAQMAKNKNVYYVNVREALVNQNNVLPDDAATDGIHLNKRYCQKWLEYLTNHVV